MVIPISTVNQPHFAFIAGLFAIVRTFNSNYKNTNHIPSCFSYLCIIRIVHSLKWKIKC